MTPFVIKSSMLAFIVTLFCIWLLAPVARHIGLSDHPGGRKHHNHSTPVVGGIGLFFGFCFGLLTLHISLSEYRGLLGGCALLLLMGIVDDIKDISQRLRLVGQLIAAFLLIVWGGYQLASLGNLFFVGPVNLGLWGMPLTVLVVLCYINAFNMIDGHDGLAGGVALIQLIALTWLLHATGLVFSSYVSTVAAAAVVAFLVLNAPLPWRKHARVFLGDAGSTVLAFIIIWFALQLSQVSVAHFRPIDALWVISYPVFDLAQVVVYRLMNGKSPLQGGREHLHHILLRMHLPKSVVALCLYAFTILLIVLGAVLQHVAISEGYVMLVWLLCMLVYVLVCNRYLSDHNDNHT